MVPQTTPVVRPGRRTGTVPTSQSEVGVGYCPGHHGELLQGIFDDGTGRLLRGLVTLPDPGHGSRALFHPSDNHGGVVGTPELIKVRRAAIFALRELSHSRPPNGPAKGGQVEIVSDVPRGIGMGSSTSDVVATIRAVADYHGVALADEEVARLAVSAEFASDSMPIDDRVVLFAHRDGSVLETFGPRLPPLVVVGCNAEPGITVDTLAFPPAKYSAEETAAFSTLRDAFRRAVATGDTALLGHVATQSALINQRFLPKTGLDRLLDLSRRYGGCGIQVAHSGTVAGVMFDPRQAGAAEGIAGCIRAIANLDLAHTTVIETP